jgi:hypothetical protein
MDHSRPSQEQPSRVCPKTVGSGAVRHFSGMDGPPMIENHGQDAHATGCPHGHTTNGRRPTWLLPLTGFFALLWFLIRVVPKPSRATYPCQRAAAPLACGFVVWVLGALGSIFAYRKARRLFRQSRYIVGACAVVVAVMAIFWPLCVTNVKLTKAAPFVPVDPANMPIGVGKGVHPGRVVWVYDPALNDQHGTAGSWWEDRRTDPNVAQSMMARAIRNLTGLPDEAEAWDTLFRYFNWTHHGLDVGYSSGEKIAIKVNNIFSRSYRWDAGQTNRPSPQMLYALVWQLVNVAGVADSDITVYDCIFYHGDPVYNYVHADFPGVRFAEGDATDRNGYEGGPGLNPGERIKVQPDPNVRVYYGDPSLVADSGLVCLPTVVTEASYLIDIALPRPHELAGVTLCAKNFFGSVWHPNYWSQYHGWNPEIMHAAVAAYDFTGGIKARPMGSYNALVDLLGHKELGGKVLLFFVECLRYRYWSAPPFNGGLTSSLFISQDGVAIDSVLVDFLRSEGAVAGGAIDNYLHEAALANDPPSGTFYDPENDGIPLESLGVHEHWNNAVDKQYSRNLGGDEGIELVQVLPGDSDPDGDDL